MLDAVHDGSRRQAGVLLLQGKKGRPRDFGGCESLVAQQIPFNHSSLGTWSPDLFLPKDPGVLPYPRFLVPHVAQMVKNLPSMWKSWVRSLGWEDPRRRKWQPTPVFLPGEFHGQRSLAGYSPWGHRVRHTFSFPPSSRDLYFRPPATPSLGLRVD